MQAAVATPTARRSQESELSKQKKLSSFLAGSFFPLAPGAVHSEVCVAHTRVQPPPFVNQLGWSRERGQPWLTCARTEIG